MKLTFLFLLAIFLVGCSGATTYKAKKTFTLDEFNRGSLKAQSMYDQIIDDNGYSNLQPGITYEQTINMLNRKKQLILAKSKKVIRFKFIAKNGKPVDYITVFKFKNNILVRRYLDFKK